MPDRVISVPQATQIAQRIKNKFDNVNGRLVNVGGSFAQVSDSAQQTIMDELLYPTLPFEIGNIGFYTDRWAYTDKVTRIRTPEGKGFHVSEGDVISLSDYTDARFYMGIMSSDGVLHNAGWNTQDKTCMWSGICVLLISNITEKTVANISDLASLVTVTKNSNIISRVNLEEERAKQLGLDAVDNFGTMTYAEVPFERGDIIYSNNELTYPSSFSVLRTPQNYSLGLNVGDKIMLSNYSDAQISAICVNGQTVTVYGFQTEDLTITVAGKYKFKIRNGSASWIEKPKPLYTLFKVVRKTETIRRIEAAETVLSDPNYTYDIYPIKGVSHRGVQYSAPENTMPAFRLSVQNGFKYIETDVQMTSDNVPILIHDSTVDRTTDGTGAVSSFTLAQIRELDAGSWFGSQFEGTKIPTLEEFLVFCKRTGVFPYLELKMESTYTQAQVHQIVEMVRQYGMLNSVTWISWSNDWLNMVLKEDKKARIGRARNIDITDGGVTSLNQLKTGYNRVFWLYNITASNITLTDAGIAKAKNASQDIEIGVVSTEADMATILDALNESGYISGCLSNGTVNFAEVVKARVLES